MPHFKAGPPRRTVQKVDVTISQASPGTGTKYVVLPLTKNCRIKSINISCAWTVQPTPLEVHVTVDGIAWRWYFNDPVTATDYYASLQANTAENSQTLATTKLSDRRSYLLEGKSIKVEAEITGGTVSNLSCRVKYAQKEP